MMYKILFSNIGYARGIDGTLKQHISGFYRNFYTSRMHQHKVLAQLRDIIDYHHPDLCCLVEVESGSWTSAYLNHIDHMSDEQYSCFDITDKYGATSYLKYLPFHQGKANGFLSKTEVEFEHLYLPYGSKRLIYKLCLPQGIVLYFLHFSLKRQVRKKQFEYMNGLIRSEDRPTIIMADFNIFTGFDELKELIQGTDLEILNDEECHTFLFHNQCLALDLCLCSASLAAKAEIDIVDQPFSDHQALIVSFDF